MFTPTITVDDHTGFAKNFKLIRQDGTGTLRIDEQTTLSFPRSLAIKHAVQGKGVSAIDRHLIQLLTAGSNEAGVPEQLLTNLTVAMPRSATFSNGDVYRQLYVLMSLLLNMSAFDAAESLGTADFSIIDGLLIGEA